MEEKSIAAIDPASVVLSIVSPYRRRGAIQVLLFAPPQDILRLGFDADRYT
jgi:hypothetical protein